MKTITIIGSGIVTLALLSYSIAILKEQKKKVITKPILVFLTAGVFLDIVATTCMIIGSTNTPFTLHGFIGYSGLLAMLIDMILIWRIYMKSGLGANVNKSIHLYSRYAYIWWVVVYISGGLMVMIN